MRPEWSAGSRFRNRLAEEFGLHRPLFRRLWHCKNRQGRLSAAASLHAAIAARKAFVRNETVFRGYRKFEAECRSSTTTEKTEAASRSRQLHMVALSEVD